MHAYRRFIQEQLDARGWDRAEFARRSKLSRQQVHRLLRDEREQLPERPEPRTVSAVASAFGIGEERVWLAIAEAMGLPVGTTPVGDAQLLSDDDLLREVGARLHARRRVTTGEVSVVHVRAYEDLKPAARAYLKGDTVAINLTDTDGPTVIRVVDYCGGMVAGRGGDMEQADDRVLVLLQQPKTADQSVESRADFAIAAIEQNPGATVDNPGGTPPGQSEEPQT